MGEFISELKAAWVGNRRRKFYQSTRGIMTPEERQALEEEFERKLAEHDRKVAEKVLKDLEAELVGSMDDGTFIAPWVEIPAGAIRETIWTVFDSYRAEAYRQERKEQ